MSEPDARAVVAALLQATNEHTTATMTEVYIVFAVVAAVVVLGAIGLVVDTLRWDAARRRARGAEFARARNEKRGSDD